jgi:hypothetical protein
MFPVIKNNIVWSIFILTYNELNILSDNNALKSVSLHLLEPDDFNLVATKATRDLR